MTGGDAMTAAAEELAIRRSLTVETAIERAFDVFTRGVASWWPLETHSMRASRDGLAVHS